MVQVTTKDGYILGVQRIPWGGLIRRQQIGHQSQHQWLNSLTKPIQKAGTEPFFGFGGPRPPPPPQILEKKRGVYILLTDLSNFTHIKLDLPPSTKSLTPLNKMKKPKKHLHI